MAEHTGQLKVTRGLTPLQNYFYYREYDLEPYDDVGRGDYWDIRYHVT